MKISEEVTISENGFLFNSKTGDSFNLNPVALELIRIISLGKKPDEIRKEFTSRYDVDELTFEKDFYEFVTLLKYYQITVQDGHLEFNY